jgi:hypothetical protein
MFTDSVMFRNGSGSPGGADRRGLGFIYIYTYGAEEVHGRAGETSNPET